MAERILFDVYRRSGGYYASASMDGPGGDWAVLPDVTPVEPTVESIAATLRNMEPLVRNVFAEAAKPATNDYGDDDDKYWERMGAKSRKQFVRSTTYCKVDFRSEQITIWYMVPDAKGYIFWSHGEEPDAKLPPDASYEDIARVVLEVFAKYPPPPRRHSGHPQTFPKERCKGAIGQSAIESGRSTRARGFGRGISIGISNR